MNRPMTSIVKPQRRTNEDIYQDATPIMQTPIDPYLDPLIDVNPPVDRLVVTVGAGAGAGAGAGGG
jgi:hypothetical protein